VPRLQRTRWRRTARRVDDDEVLPFPVPYASTTGRAEQVLDLIDEALDSV
jgi:hypothetical protein